MKCNNHWNFYFYYQNIVAKVTHNLAEHDASGIVATNHISTILSCGRETHLIPKINEINAINYLFLDIE